MRSNEVTLERIFDTIFGGRKPLILDLAKQITLSVGRNVERAPSITPRTVRCTFASRFPTLSPRKNGYVTPCGPDRPFNPSLQPW